MSRSSLAIELSKLRVFKNPSTKLEQYATPSEVAATILWDSFMKGLIKDKTILDLGCGTGVLGIGALLLGARKVVFVDKDPEAIKLLRKNLEMIEADNKTFEIMLVDVEKQRIPKADLVLMNPPFGTKKKHIDLLFLEKALESSNELYSIHKSSTNDYLREWFLRKKLVIVEKIDFNIALKPTMSRHKKKSHVVNITCWHVRSAKNQKDL